MVNRVNICCNEETNTLVMEHLSDPGQVFGLMFTLEGGKKQLTKCKNNQNAKVINFSIN